jgi:hypothetical protein
MGGLLAKIADIAWEIFRGGREIEARVNSAAAGALVHLEGVRDAPHGDSSEYRDEKGYLGGELKKLTLAAGERPGKFKDELEIAMLVQNAVVIRGERFVDGYITQLKRIVPVDS